jgi:hypothetical protein
MVIVDEMHAINEALLSSLKTYNNTHKAFLYGFSATPSSTKTQYFGNHVIFTYQSSQAIEDGVLAPWIFKTLEYDIKIPAEVQRFKNELAHFLKNEPHPGGGTLADNRGVIWVPSIVFADELASQLQKDGFKAVAIHSSSLKARELINKFSKNSPDITILVAVDMLKLGFDAAVDFEIIAKKVIKPAEWKQMLGRALRGGRLFDKASDLEEGCFKASGSKIAYIFALRNSIDEKITTSLSARALAQLALDPDYIAHPFRDSDIQDAASNDAEDFDEEQWWKAGCPPLERPFDGFIGNITKLETSRGKKHSVVIQQFKTDDNEFSALGINRQDFIKRVYVQNADPNFASLRWQAIESLSMHSLHEWEYLYGQRDVMGRPKYNLNIEHLKLISLIYNVKLYLYTIEDPDIELILTPLEDYSVIYEGPNLYESKDLHLANIGMPEFKRFERMLFTDEYADNHSIISPYTQEGLEGLFSDDANYGRYFNPTYPYLNNLINLLSDHR